MCCEAVLFVTELDNQLIGNAKELYLVCVSLRLLLHTWLSVPGIGLQEWSNLHHDSFIEIYHFIHVHGRFVCMLIEHMS